MSLATLLGRRTSTYYLAVLVSAFFIERTITLGSDTAFDKFNEGVSTIV